MKICCYLYVCNEAVEYKLVKLVTSRTVILPPTVSDLCSEKVDNTHLRGEGSLYSWSPVKLNWIQLFHQVQKTTQVLSSLVKSNLVTLEASCIVILTPTLSVIYFKPSTTGFQFYMFGFNCFTVYKSQHILFIGQIQSW